MVIETQREYKEENNVKIREEKMGQKSMSKREKSMKWKTFCEKMNITDNPLAKLTEEKKRKHRFKIAGKKSFLSRPSLHTIHKN